MMCETCEGTGKVQISNDVVTDRGSKWQQSAVEMVWIECPHCDGEGRDLSYTYETEEGTMQ